MFRPLARSHRRPHRRGTSFVLIVVVMISFAAAVGVAFALFAGQTLRIAAANKEAQGAGGSPPARAPEPANTVNQFLSALIFGVGNDSPSDLTNALRGHSIAASMYGSTAGNTTPWAGVGTFSEDMSTYGVPGLTGDRSAAVNYTQMQFTGGSGSVRFLLDPEWTGYRASGTTPAGTWPANFAAGLNGRTYVGKHAPYSFPDLKDFFAGAVDPATGQVLVQSFHRPWLWNMTVTSGTTTTTYGLDPGNPNWTNTPGRLKTLRPRPAEHPLFPRVPPNYDNSYTGDVQNWPGGYTYGPDPSNPTQNRYNARNDSLWMHIGLPTVPFGNRMVQPLVAPLIVPLDGLLNASAHGNNFGPNGAHLSYAGYGPWEVNVSGFLNGDPATALSVNRSNVVAARGTAQQRSGNTVRSYDPYRTMQVPNPSGMGTITVPRPLPTYSPVAWSGAQVGLPTYPAGNSITGLPSFPAFQSDNALVGPPNSASHPALFNPAEWPTTGGTNARGFPLTDIKRMHLRYAFTPDWYIPSDLASNAPQDLGVNRTFSYAVVANTASDYRLDPAHPNRALFTTRGFGLDRPKVAPNFATRDGALGLAMAGNKPGALSTGVGPFPAPGTPLGTVTDFTAGRWVNRMAVLGAVDINRPLTDYRVDMTKPLTAPNNVTTTSAGPADNDRRKLAHDIFVRLAAATGASLQISLTGTQHPTPQYAVPTGLPAAQLNALRYLAQLAVNVVDYRDDDDISTAFVWNPIDPTDPYNAANFAAAEVGNRVVFGVEKSRLVLNEVYSEIANAPTDPVNGEDKDNDKMPDPLPTGSLAHVRFWAELLNPTSTSNVTGYGPIDDNVSLTGYQIQIARANRTTGAAAAQDMASYVYDPANTTGSFPVGQQPDASFTFTASTGNAGSPTTVAPNNGTSLPSTTAPNTLPKQGVVLVAPPSWTPKTDPNTMMPNSQEFDPQPAANTVWAPGNVLYSPALGPAGAMAASPGMGYTLSMSVNANNNQAVPNPATTEFRRHVVLLRRLANPYVVPDPASPAAGVVNNPYVTVDVMDYVPSFDAVHRFVNDRTDRGSNPGNPNGYDAGGSRFAVGKVQPYAGHAFTTVKGGAGAANYNQYSFPTSMVLNQQLLNADPARTEPVHTFGRHNSKHAGSGADPLPANTFVPSNPNAMPAVTSASLSDTLMTPFDWLPQMDRMLVNEIELFQVRDTPPHLVPENFLQATAIPPAPAPAPGVTYELGSAQWRFTDNGVGRALEYLTVKPFTAGVAHGGRVPGKVNVNAIPDKRVLNGLLDPQPGNAFNAAFVNNNAWNVWMASRNGVTTRTLATGGTAMTTDTPGQSVLDGTGGTSRPFLSFGAPAVAGIGPGGFAYTGGGGESLTVLRSDGSPVPQLYTTLPAYGATYFGPEPLRKMMNNITTVNHTYLVFLTIGYFELDGQNTVDLGGGVTMPRLAHEACLSVPGDMRQKFVAVIDMSGMAINQTARQYFTTLEQTAYAGATTLLVATDANGNAVATDGTTVAIGGTLYLGYGAEEQVVSVQSVTPVTVNNGVNSVVMGQVTLAAPLTRTAWGGSSVSNVRPGYPGVQPGFKYSDPNYKPVLPYIERIK